MYKLENRGFPSPSRGVRFYLPTFPQPSDNLVSALVLYVTKVTRGKSLCQLSPLSRDPSAEPIIHSALCDSLRSEPITLFLKNGGKESGKRETEWKPERRLSPLPGF